MTPIKPTPGEETLKAWVHWVLLNPLDEDQQMHAEATRALFERIKELEFRIQMMLDDGECEMYRRQAAESIGYTASPYDKPPAVGEALDHPCRQSCSGWQQGYERGIDAAQAREQRLIEAFEGLVKELVEAADGAPYEMKARIFEQAAEWAQAALAKAKGEKE